MSAREKHLEVSKQWAVTAHATMGGGGSKGEGGRKKSLFGGKKPIVYSEMKTFPGFPQIKIASATHIGYGGKKKENQDAFVIQESFGGNADMLFAGVFDGHGRQG